MNPEAAGADRATTSCNGRSGACSICRPRQEGHGARHCPRRSELLELLQATGARAPTREARRAIWHEMLDALHRPGLLDRHRQRHAAAGRRQSSRHAEHSRQGLLRLRSRPAISASIMPTPSGMTTGRPDACCATSSGASPSMVPTLLIISALVFTIIELPPGDYFES